MGIFSAIKYLIILAIVIAIGAGLWYVMNLKADLATSEANSQQLETALQEQGAVLAQMKNDVQQIKIINEDLSRQKEDLQKDREVLTSKFSKRDFGALAAEKPSVIERLVNRGTVNAMRCLEIASGSSLTEKELAAKTPTEANRECPALINPAYTALN